MPLKRNVICYYSGPEWKHTVKQLRARARGCCEGCRVRNGLTVQRIAGAWSTTGRLWHSNEGGLLIRRPAGQVRRIKVVCTSAHLDRTPGHDDLENLRWLCQWCHLDYDRQANLAVSRETRMERKDAARPLLQEVEWCDRQLERVAAGQTMSPHTKAFEVELGISDVLLEKRILAGESIQLGCELS